MISNICRSWSRYRAAFREERDYEGLEMYFRKRKALVTRQSDA